MKKPLLVVHIVANDIKFNNLKYYKGTSFLCVQKENIWIQLSQVPWYNL